MSLTKAWSLLVVLAVAALTPRGIVAQSTDVSCLSSFGWMNNTKNQNPCLVAAYLQGACYDGVYTVGSLPIDNYYVGPYVDEANGCECNTVTYSLVSACGDCQNRTFEAWSSWSYNCSTIYNASFPMDIPSGTAVPQWAYLDVITSGIFNPAAAHLAGDSPESTATKVQSTGSVISTTTSASVSLTSLPTVTGSSSTTQSPTPTSSSSNVGTIAGGVVGGVVGIAVIGGLAAWFFVKHRHSKIASPTVFNNLNGDPGHTQSVYSNNPNTFIVQHQITQQQPRLYDPSDPSTFPISPISPTIRTTSSGDIYQSPLIPSQVYQSRPGQYGGAPEV